MAGAGVQLRPTALCVGEQGGSTFLGRVFRRPSLSLQVEISTHIYMYLHCTYLHISKTIYMYLPISTPLQTSLSSSSSFSSSVVAGERQQSTTPLPMPDIGKYFLR